MEFLGPHRKKIIGVFSTFFVGGFFNGYISHPRHCTKEQADKLLIADRISQGLYAGIFHVVYIPIVVYRNIGKLEIYYKNKNPNDYPEIFETSFNLTTLYKVNCK